MAKFLEKRRGIRSLVIQDLTGFVLNSAKLTMILRGLRQLDRLCLNFGRSDNERLSFKYPEVPLDLPLSRGRLTQLSTIAIDIQAPVKQIIDLNLETLQVLDLINPGPGVDTSFRSIVLPCLKKLRIFGTQQLNLVHRFPLPRMEMVSPTRCSPVLRSQP